MCSEALPRGVGELLLESTWNLLTISMLVLQGSQSLGARASVTETKYSLLLSKALSPLWKGTWFSEVNWCVVTDDTGWWSEKYCANKALIHGEENFFQAIWSSSVFVNAALTQTSEKLWGIKMSLLKFITSFPLFKKGEESESEIADELYGKVRIDSSCKEEQNHFKTHPFLTINKERDLNYISILWTCFKWRVFCYA